MHRLHSSSFFGLPYRVLYIKGTTLEPLVLIQNPKAARISDISGGFRTWPFPILVLEAVIAGRFRLCTT